MICGMIAMLSVSSLARAKDIQFNIFVFPSLAIFERFRIPIAKDFSQADRSSLPSHFRRANLLVEEELPSPIIHLVPKWRLARNQSIRSNPRSSYGSVVNLAPTGARRAAESAGSARRNPARPDSTLKFGRRRRGARGLLPRGGAPRSDSVDHGSHGYSG